MHTLHIDVKYLNFISSKLPLFKRIKSNSYNFRCPICGDSKKRENKARGYMFSVSDGLIYKCHNCSVSLSFSKFLEHVDALSHKEYVLEIMKEKGEQRKLLEILEEPVEEETVSKDVLRSIKKISQLPAGHFAKEYVESRKIPRRFHYLLYYVKNFKKWTNSIVPDSFANEDFEHPRLIIPYFSRKGDLLGYQGRDFQPKSQLRYITIKINQTHPKVFGLERLDYSERVYITEGPIDSFHLPNCLGMMGADMSDINTLGIPKDNVIYVYDNEPRNSEIVKKIEKTIQTGHKVVIWPNEIKMKDLNSMRVHGLTDNQITCIVEDSVFSGIKAYAKLNQWKKI